MRLCMDWWLITIKNIKIWLMKIIKLFDANSLVGMLLIYHVQKVISFPQHWCFNLIVTHPRTSATSQWNVFRVKEVIGLSDRYTPIQGLGSIQGIYYTFGLYFTTFGSLVSHLFRRRLYNNGFMISFCWLIDESTLKNSAFDKIVKIHDRPKNCDGPQKAWFLHVLLCRQLSTSAFEFCWFVDNENTCRYQP